MEQELIRIFFASAIEDFKFERLSFRDILKECNDTFSARSIDIRLEPVCYGDVYREPYDARPENQKRIEKEISTCRYFIGAFDKNIGNSVISEIMVAHDWKESTSRTEPFYMYLYHLATETEMNSDAKAMYDIITNDWHAFSHYVSPKTNAFYAQLHKDLNKLCTELEQNYFSRNFERYMKILLNPPSGEQDEGWKQWYDVFSMAMRLLSKYPDNYIDQKNDTVRNQVHQLEDLIAQKKPDKLYTLIAVIDSISERIKTILGKKKEETFSADMRTLSSKGRQAFRENRYEDAIEVFTNIEKQIVENPLLGSYEIDNIRAEAKERHGDCLYAQKCETKALPFYRDAYQFFQHQEIASKRLKSKIDEIEKKFSPSGGTSAGGSATETPSPSGGTSAGKSASETHPPDDESAVETPSPSSGTPTGGSASETHPPDDESAVETPSPSSGTPTGGSASETPLPDDESAAENSSPSGSETPQSDESASQNLSLGTDKAKTKKMTDEEQAQLANFADDYLEQAQQLRKKALEHSGRQQENYWNGANKLYRKSLDIYEQLIHEPVNLRKTRNPSHRKKCTWGWGYAVVCNNYANFLYDRQEYQKAIELYQKALSIYQFGPRDYTSTAYEKIQTNLNLVRDTISNSKSGKAFHFNLFPLFHPKK